MINLFKKLLTWAAKIIGAGLVLFIVMCIAALCISYFYVPL